MNPILILARNNLALTQRCVASCLAQDIPTAVMVIDNGSTDGTAEWLDTAPVDDWERFDPQLGVSAGWNYALGLAFEYGADHCLCPGNDTVLAPWTYRELLSYDVPFVTGVAVDDMQQIAEPAPKMELVAHPDFSLMLMRKLAWDTVGPFDPRMVHYASDTDWHVRAHRLGVPAWKANVRFFHERSSTLRLASPEERVQIEAQANADRAVFHSLYGCLPGTPEYNKLFE